MHSFFVQRLRCLASLCQCRFKIRFAHDFLEPRLELRGNLLLLEVVLWGLFFHESFCWSIHRMHCCELRGGQRLGLAVAAQEEDWLPSTSLGVCCVQAERFVLVEVEHLSLCLTPAGLQARQGPFWFGDIVCMKTK